MTTHLRTLAAARLDALVRQAAQDPEVPSVMAMVVATSVAPSVTSRPTVWEVWLV